MCPCRIARCLSLFWLLLFAVAHLCVAELDLSLSNGTSGHIYSPLHGSDQDRVELADDSVESLRGQTFVARVPDSEDAGWLVDRVTLSIDRGVEYTTLGSGDKWTVTIIEWDATFDGNEIAAWLEGTPADALAGFSEPKILLSDSGAFESDTEISRPFFIFDLEEASHFFVEAGKAYAVYFKNEHSADTSLFVKGGFSVRSDVGVMIFQEADASPAVSYETDLSVFIDGVAHTPDDGNDLAPRFSVGGDIELPMNWDPYSEIMVNGFNAFNEGQSLVGYTVSSDNPGLFNAQPAIDLEGRLTFESALGKSGVAVVSVYATDDGLTNNRSMSRTFTITIRDREALVWHVDEDTPAVVENQDGLSWSTAFSDLQDALAVSFLHDEIWVAEGFYYPNEAAAGKAILNENEEDETFQLIEGVDVYGGFAGGEVDREFRDPKRNRTVLSGDIDRETNPDQSVDGVVQEDAVNAINGANSKVVVSGTEEGNVVLDGFVITAGDSTSYGLAGGFSGSGELYRCVIQGNKGIWVGGVRTSGPKLYLIECDLLGNYGKSIGGMEAFSAELIVVNCRIQGNSTLNSSFGNSVGGIHALGCEAQFIGCLFSGNRGYKIGALSIGLGQELAESTEIENCTVTGNEGIGEATEFQPVVGGVSAPHVADMTIENTLIWGNFPFGESYDTGIKEANTNGSLVEGRSLGANNLDGVLLAGEALFILPIDATESPSLLGNFSLKADSAVLDQGDETLLPFDFLDLDEDDIADERLPFDLVGNDRLNSELDIGAFERGRSTDPFASLADFRSFYGLSRSGENDAEDWSGIGVGNLAYFAFGLADQFGSYPNYVDVEDGEIGLPRLGRAGKDAAYRVEFVRLKSQFDELDFKIERSQDLLAWQTVEESDYGESVLSVDERYEFVVAEIPAVETELYFYRLSVEARN